MPINRFKCDLCGFERDSMRAAPKCNHNQEEEGVPHPVREMTKILAAPQAKFLEPRDEVSKDRGKSVLKDQNKILKERARNHSRDVDMDDLIQSTPKEAAAGAKWLRADGTKRKKIDDL